MIGNEPDLSQLHGQVRRVGRHDVVFAAPVGKAGPEDGIEAVGVNHRLYRTARLLIHGQVERQLLAGLLSVQHISVQISDGEGPLRQPPEALAAGRDPDLSLVKETQIRRRAGGLSPIKQTLSNPAGFVQHPSAFWWRCLLRGAGHGQGAGEEISLSEISGFQRQTHVLIVQWDENRHAGRDALPDDKGVKAQRQGHRPRGLTAGNDDAGIAVVKGHFPQLRHGLLQRL